jgi:hypothetical protein
VARNALEVSALPTPWLPQDTTPMALEGADAEDPQIPSAPRPPSGPSQEGRDDRTQGRRRLGVRGEGGLPLRGGGRAGTGSARGAPPLALAEGLALGWAGVRGIVAARKASRRRLRGVGQAPGIGVVT